MSERRRALQRMAISREAARLFRTQGIAATTTEQIAEAAAMSERTVRRYFGSKEYSAEPLLAAAVDELVDALRRWPPERSLGQHLELERPGQATLDDRETIFALISLTESEPAIRAIWLFLFERAATALAGVVGGRLERSPRDPAVRVHAAALAVALRITIEDVAAEAASDAPVDSAALARRLADAVGVASRGLPGTTPSPEG